ncbi:MAG: hypothetical protein IJZ10_11845 [Thermoguttaceae bacterium]|nr:hypothetical protein [Thermoguttaceae bacterium]
MSWWKFWKRDAPREGAPKDGVFIAPLSPRVRTGYVNAAGRDLADYLTDDDAKSAVIAIKSSGRVAFWLDKIIKYHKDYNAINPFALRDLEKTLAGLTPACDAIVSAVVRWLRCLPV